MKIEKTPRGFELIKFKDCYDIDCSLQQSSVAEYEAIWLGVSDVKPKILASQAASCGVKTKQTTGWVDYPVPSEVLLASRMHLNREQVKELVGFLTKWLKNGSFY